MAPVYIIYSTASTPSWRHALTGPTSVPLLCRRAFAPLYVLSRRHSTRFRASTPNKGNGKPQAPSKARRSGDPGIQNRVQQECLQVERESEASPSYAFVSAEYIVPGCTTRRLPCR
ncbi:unnamed protein product [Euphydryas editha]|uniref:Uncharacterized protein n=1 Tax=Euphydryas editha TaxID=104508 RepID=A0AAU9TGM0_EUPED|nr:unnamed protein product [Euphydryas editha]